MIATASLASAPRQQQHDPLVMQCIELCRACYQSCQQTALTHCLDPANAHVEPNHFRLMADCAQACRVAADRMASGNGAHDECCRTCAEVCRECAASCAALGDMDECVALCRRCAEACAAMSGADASVS